MGIKKSKLLDYIFKRNPENARCQIFFQLNNAIRLPYGRKRIDRPKQN